MGLWPSKKQWKSWTLPTKIGVIGGYAGIVAIPLSISLFVVTCLLQPNLDDIVRRMAAEHETELNKEYPTAHTVFGVYQDRDIVPTGQMPENLEIDWETGNVQSTNNNVLMVTLPDMILNGKSFVGGNTTFLAKQIGAKSGSIIKLGWFNPILEVIGIDGELVVVALGFPVCLTKLGEDMLRESGVTDVLIKYKSELMALAKTRGVSTPEEVEQSARYAVNTFDWGEEAEKIDNYMLSHPDGRMFNIWEIAAVRFRDMLLKELGMPVPTGIREQE